MHQLSYGLYQSISLIFGNQRPSFTPSLKQAPLDLPYESTIRCFFLQPKLRDHHGSQIDQEGTSKGSQSCHLTPSWRSLNPNERVTYKKHPKKVTFWKNPGLDDIGLFSFNRKLYIWTSTPKHLESTQVPCFKLPFWKPKQCKLFGGRVHPRFFFQMFKRLVTIFVGENFVKVPAPGCHPKYLPTDSYFWGLYLQQKHGILQSSNDSFESRCTGILTNSSLMLEWYSSKTQS